MTKLNKKYTEDLHVVAKRLGKGSLKNIESWKQLTKGLRKYENNLSRRGNIDIFELVSNTIEVVANVLEHREKVLEFFNFKQDLNALKEKELKDFYLVVCLLYREQKGQPMEDDAEYVKYYRKLF